MLATRFGEFAPTSGDVVTTSEGGGGGHPAPRTSESIPTTSAFAALFGTTCRNAMRPVTGPAPIPERVAVK